MPRSIRVATIAVNGVCMALLLACSTAPPGTGGNVTSVVAPYPPPPKHAEIPPPAPTADSLWQCGHWTWNGMKYLWSPGTYLQRPTPTANWMPGYWEQDAGGWIWTEGHWQS
jgi:hypothetical protein